VALVLFPLMSQAQEQQKLYLGDKEVVNGYRLLNLNPDLIDRPLNSKIIHSVSREEINDLIKKATPGVASFDPNVSTDGSGSLHIKSDSDNITMAPIVDISGLNLKAEVYWIRILVRGKNINDSIAIKLNNTYPDPRYDRPYEELFVWNRSEFDWSYYILKLGNAMYICGLGEPIKSIYSFLELTGKGELWIDKIDVMELEMPKSYDSTKIPCDHGAHKH
jgi:hypothetical protein